MNPAPAQDPWLEIRRDVKRLQAADARWYVRPTTSKRPGGRTAFTHKVATPASWNRGVGEEYGALAMNVAGGGLHVPKKPPCA